MREDEAFLDQCCIMPTLISAIRRHRSSAAWRCMWMAPWLMVAAGCSTSTLNPQPEWPKSLSNVAWQTTLDGLPGHGTPDDAALSQWWEQFQDPTLTVLIQTALSQNLDLKVAQATIRQVRASRAEVEANLSPQIGFNASARQANTDGANSSSSSLGFSASWEPDWWGTKGQAISAAQATLEAAQSDAATTRMTLTAEVALAYLGWRSVQAQQALVKDSIDRLNTLLQLTAWREQAGLVSGLDKTQAQQSLSQAQSSLPALATSQAQYEHQLALLTGRTPSELAKALRADSTTWALSTDALVQQVNVGMPADVLLRRPDVQAAQARWRAQWSQREQVRTRQRPTLSINGSVGLQALSMAAFSGGGSLVSALAASINWPFLDGGQHAAQMDQQSAALDKADATLQKTVLTAIKDVEDSLVALRGAQQQQSALAATAQQAQEVLRLTRIQYDAGLVDLRTLLTTERDALSAQTNRQNAQTAVAQSLVQLFKALGGGWTPADLQVHKDAS